MPNSYENLMIFCIFATVTKTIFIFTNVVGFLWLQILCNPMNHGYHLERIKSIFKHILGHLCGKNNENYSKIEKITTKSSRTYLARRVHRVLVISSKNIGF